MTPRRALTGRSTVPLPSPLQLVTYVTCWTTRALAICQKCYRVVCAAAGPEGELAVREPGLKFKPGYHYSFQNFTHGRCEADWPVTRGEAGVFSRFG